MAYTSKQLVMAYTAIHNGVAPDAIALADLGNRAAQNAAGAMTDAQTLSFVINGADNSTALAVLSYQFFTGKSPTADGLTYLLNSSANPNDLGDAYYSGFNTENRYINFAANLGVQGDGAAAFAGKYGAMSFPDYVASIYETVIGATYAKAAGIDVAKAVADIISRQDAILATAQSAGMITPGMTTAQIDLAVKAATAGYLLGEAIKADVGLYAGAANNFALALAKGDAVYGADITTTYKPSADQGVGQPVTQTPPESALPGYVPPPPPEPATPAVAAPLSFTLTTADDTFTGDTDDDTFSGILGTGATLNAGDKLNGGAGIDTLTLSGAGGSFTFDPTKITNIEKLQVTGTATTLDLTGMSFTQLAIGAGAVILNGITTIPTQIALSGIGGSASTTLNFQASALTGHSDTANLVLNNVMSSGVLKIAPASGTDGFETLNITSGGSSANSIVLAIGTQASLATLNISGAAALALRMGSSTDKIRTIATIDASTATGNITIGNNTTSTSLGAANQIIKLGSGDDLVYFGANLTSADTVDGGAGFDTVSVSVSSGITDSTVLNGVSNVEALRFIASSSLTQDVRALAGHGLSEIQLEGSGSSTFQFSHLPASGITTVTLRSNMSAATLSLALDVTSGGADSLTLNFANPTTTATTLGTLAAIAGLETLNIVSGGNALSNTISTINLAFTTRQVITGSVDLTMIAGTNTAMNVDASAFTGELTINGSSISKNDIVVLGYGDDVVNMGLGTDTIYIGPQDDTSHVYRGADVIEATAGSSTTIRFTDNSQTVGGGGATSYTGVVSVSAPFGGTVSNVTVGFSANDGGFIADNAAGVHATGLSKGATAQGVVAGDTLVVQSVAQNAAATAATPDVTVIQLSTSTALTTDIKGAFAAAMGTASITGLAADANYLVEAYDSAAGTTLFAIVNTGASGAGDTTLSAADFTNTGMTLIGTFKTSALMAGLSLGAAF